MTHLDPEQLAHLAMYPDAPVDADRHAHLTDCAQCQAELTELREVAQLARTAPAGGLPPPPAGIWDRVLDAAPASAAVQRRLLWNDGTAPGAGHSWRPLRSDWSSASSEPGC